MDLKRFLTLSLMCYGLAAQADALADLEKSCRAHKKSKAECACVVRHIRERVKQKELDDQQLADLAQAEAGTPTEDAMADYLAGLEYHCHENPKY